MPSSISILAHSLYCMKYKHHSFFILVLLKAKTTQGFKSCIVISIYPLDIPLITKKLQNIKIIDKLTSYLALHNKSSRSKSRAIKVMLTNQSQVLPKGVTNADVREAQSHIGEHSIPLDAPLTSTSMATSSVVPRILFNRSFIMNLTYFSQCIHMNHLYNV